MGIQVPYDGAILEFLREEDGTIAVIHRDSGYRRGCETKSGVPDMWDTLREAFLTLYWRLRGGQPLPPEDQARWEALQQRKREQEEKWPK